MVKIDKSVRYKLWKKRVELSWQFAFAHHPLCGRYDDHVFHIPIGGKTLFLCQGCTLTVLGTIAGLFNTLFAFIPNIDYNWIHLVSVFIIIFGAIVLVELLKLKNRPLKRLIRFLGGAGLGFYIGIGFYGIMTLDVDSVFLTILSLLIVILAIKAFNFIRAREQGDKCEGCQELDKNEICPGVKMKIEAERKYSDFATKMLYSDLRPSLSRKYAKYEIKPTENIGVTDDDEKTLNSDD